MFIAHNVGEVKEDKNLRFLLCASLIIIWALKIAFYDDNFLVSHANDVFKWGERQKSR